jgi:hypothetical protein
LPGGVLIFSYFVILLLISITNPCAFGAGEKKAGAADDSSWNRVCVLRSRAAGKQVPEEERNYFVAGVDFSRLARRIKRDANNSAEITFPDSRVFKYQMGDGPRNNYSNLTITLGNKLVSRLVYMSQFQGTYVIIDNLFTDPDFERRKANESLIRLLSALSPNWKYAALDLAWANIKYIADFLSGGDIVDPLEAESVIQSALNTEALQAAVEQTPTGRSLDRLRFSAKPGRLIPATENDGAGPFLKVRWERY